MHPLAETFAAILDEEREAARKADVEALVEIQERKRVALKDLRRVDLPAQDAETLAARARENVALMRHLVQLLGATLGVGEPATYGPEGQQLSVLPPSVRGAL